MRRFPLVPCRAPARVPCLPSPPPAHWLHQQHRWPRRAPSTRKAHQPSLVCSSRWGQPGSSCGPCVLASTTAKRPRRIAAGALAPPLRGGSSPPMRTPRAEPCERAAGSATVQCTGSGWGLHCKSTRVDTLLRAKWFGLVTSGSSTAAALVLCSELAACRSAFSKSPVCLSISCHCLAVPNFFFSPCWPMGFASRVYHGAEGLDRSLLLY